MALLLKPALIRPTVLAAPIACSSIFASSSRLPRRPCFPPVRNFSILGKWRNPGAEGDASTALKPGVREAESGTKVVGKEVPGAEGAHYEGEPSSKSL